MRQPLCLQAGIRQGQVRKHLVEAKEQMMDIEAPDDAVSTFSLFVGYDFLFCSGQGPLEGGGR